MKLSINIEKIGKMVLVLLATLLLLCACSDDPDSKNNGPFDTDGGGKLSAQEASKTAEEGEFKTGASGKLECWQGNVLNILYKVIGSGVMSQYQKLSEGSMTLIMIAFAVWVALILMKFVSSVTESSPAEIWNQITRKAFVCVVCGILASSPGMLLYFINFFLFPIYSAFLDFGIQILDLSEQNIRSVNVFGEQIEFLAKNLTCSIAGDTSATLSGFPDSFQESMSCMICAMVDKLRIGRSIALISMDMEGIIPFLVGLLVWACFLVVGLGFVFYLVDSIFKFGLMIMLLPLLILSYAFGPTKKWSQIGFTNIMHSAAFMMAFSIIIATTLLAMISLISDPETGGIFNPPNPQLQFQQISVSSLCLLLVGFLVFSSMSVSQQLVSAIIGAHINAKFQQNLKAVGQTILGILSGGLGWAAQKTFLNESTAVGRLLNKSGAIKGRLKKLAGKH